MIRIESLCLQTGAFALREISLRVEKGEYFVLLGPTGAGKTLFAECLCGLVRPSSGRIEIDGRDVTHAAPRCRSIGYVPQHQGLFPHLSVRENIAFALRARRLPRAEITERIGPLIELLGLGHLLGRWPANLSGGERQKVALARAVAARPQLLILDEPVSAVDEPSRELLCSELRRIQRELQITTLHVSHNIEEAFSVSDRAGVLHDGRLMQVGPVSELLRRPATEFIARFFRTENIFEADASPSSDGTTELAFAGHVVSVPGRRTGRVTFVIRSEAIEIHRADAFVANGVPAMLKRVADRGPYRRLEFDAGLPIVVHATAEAAVRPALERDYVLAFPADAIHILAAPGRKDMPDAKCQMPEEDRSPETG